MKTEDAIRYRIAILLDRIPTGDKEKDLHIVLAIRELEWVLHD